MPPLHLNGTSFQRDVWALLLRIPYGETTTYGALAKRIAQSRGGMESVSAQAVGGAIRRNPILILVPCHRVVGAGGALTGYSGGLARKRALLEREGVDMERLFSRKRLI
ncbi:MAG: methylated-DNA--[protein]-cysteine S-methyltransferase [Kiritimatiellia bacterium]